MEILLILFAVINLVSVLAYIRLLWNNAVRLATYLLVAIMLTSILIALLTGYVPWFFGIVPCCASPLLAFVSFSILVIGRYKSFQIFEGDKQRCWLYLVGGLLIVLSQLLPLVGFYAVSGTCRTLARVRSERIVSALERYYHDYNSYPQDIELLVPEYSSDLPSVCSKEFSLVHCSSGDTLLTVDSVNGLGIERYNLRTGNWSGIDTLDFDICDLLE